MKLSIAKRLIEALESREYAKARGKLRYPPPSRCFCPLGILCDLHAKETGNSWVGDRYLEYCVIAPPEVETWAGFNATDRWMLLNWSDNIQLSFADIAAKLRKGVENGKANKTKK